VIVRQKIKRNGGDFRQQLVQRRRVCGGGTSSQWPAHADASSSHAADTVNITGWTCPLRCWVARAKAMGLQNLITIRRSGAPPAGATSQALTPI